MCFFSYKVCFLSLAERWMRNSKHQICEITSLIAVSGLICGWIRCMCFATWQISMLRQFLGIVSRALWRASYSWLETHLFKQNDWSTRLWSSVALHSQWLTKIRLQSMLDAENTCFKHIDHLPLASLEVEWPCHVGHPSSFLDGALYRDLPLCRPGSLRNSRIRQELRKELDQLSKQGLASCVTISFPKNWNIQSI